MARSLPAWQRLVEEGFFATRGDAERWILSGKVYVDEQPVTTAGQAIRRDASLTVRGHGMRYAAKGGLKLEHALRAFAIDVTGRVCIDAGASTGGFTDCLVQHGAATVYAVDVGFGQLMGSLRSHPAVVNLERTNIGDSSLLALEPRPTLGTVDLSYLSLRKAVPQFAEILHHRGELVCLVKPLFEIDDAQARRTGIIGQDTYAPLLEDLANGFIREGYPVLGITNSPVTGNQGTLEFFIHLGLDAQDEAPEMNLREAIHAAVEAAQALPAYQK